MDHLIDNRLPRRAGNCPARPTTTAAAFVEKLNAQIEYVAENTKCSGCGERMKAIEHEPGRWRFECQAA